MFVFEYLPAISLLVSLAQASPSGFRHYFVHPNERKGELIHGRIVGGQLADPHAYPYQVGMNVYSSKGTAFCGGSLVSKNYVLTAAHCVDGAIGAHLIFGAQNIMDNNEASQVQVYSLDFLVHPGWDRLQLINDIALIRLPQPIEETDAIKIIKIADGDSSYAGDEGLVSGWGLTSNEDEGIAPVLKYLVSDILSNKDCEDIDPYGSIIKPTHLCLSGHATTGNVGTCNGDSGGPLVSNGVQVGLVSFGYMNCMVGKPSVFTRLTEFKDWLRENSDINI